MSKPYEYPPAGSRGFSRNNKDRILVPCGKCAICLTNRRNDWAVRLLEESKNYLDCDFLTLTYNDDHYEEVSKTTLQLFFKRLRKRGLVFRYYAVAEYGSITRRSHYHLLMFGVSNLSHDYWVAVDKSWVDGNGNSLGFVKHGDVNIASIQYCCKYHVNPDEKGFVLMSKGIGRNYIDKMADFHLNNIDRSFYPLNQKKLKLPRYFKEKLYDRSERDKISVMHMLDNFPHEEIEKYNAKYPKSSYFKMKFDLNLQNEMLFSKKSKLNKKL